MTINQNSSLVSGTIGGEGGYVLEDLNQQKGVRMKTLFFSFIDLNSNVAPEPCNAVALVLHGTCKFIFENNLFGLYSC